MESIKLYTYLLLIGAVKSDQPVHCLGQEINGEWNFHISKETQAVNLYETNEVCTH